MNFSWKTGVLLLILAIPVLIYLFLQSFGSNSYAIPVYYEEGVVSSLQNCEFSEGQHYIPDFSLTSQAGKDISSELLENRVTVVDFFFTSCPDICPIMTGELNRVQEVFKNNETVKMLSFTVDPAYDTPQVLREYATEYNIDTSQWKFATGEKEDIYSLARCGFLLPVEDGDGSKADFIHSEKVILVDGHKRIRGYYDGTDREDIDRLITEINILLTERNS
jgi:protein SCO1